MTGTKEKNDIDGKLMHMQSAHHDFYVNQGLPDTSFEDPTHEHEHYLISTHHEIDKGALNDRLMNVGVVLLTQVLLFD